MSSHAEVRVSNRFDEPLVAGLIIGVSDAVEVLLGTGVEVDSMTLKFSA